jgi:mRNA interferase MazF
LVTARRGDIWWTKQPNDERQAGDASSARRPYLVVSSDSWNLVEEYPRITVCPLTGAENVPRRYDTDVILRRRETSLPKDSVARCTEIYTIFRSVLLERVGRIPDHRMAEVEQALRLYLALETA